MPGAVAGRAASGRRRGRGTWRSTTRTRSTSNLELRRALAHAVDREALARGGARQHGRGHGRDRAARAPGPHARHRAAVRSGPRARAPGAIRLRRRARRSPGIVDVGRPVLDPVGGVWRDVLGLDVDASTVVDAASASAIDRSARRGADLLHRVAARLRRSRVLPAAAVPVRQPDERGRVLAPAVRRADRAGAAGAERPRRGWSCSTRPTGWRWPTASRCIPLVYGRSMAFVKPWVHGWWEFGKSSSTFADLLVDPTSPARESTRPGDR